MSTASLTIQTQAGPVIGFADTYPLRNESAAKLDPAQGGKTSVLKWLGIPYAKAGRWERPTPPDAWTKPRECFEFGTTFPQTPSNAALIFGTILAPYAREFVQQSEASHNLNIFAPEGTKPGDKLPVMVWIYGGSLNNGSSHAIMYDGTEWIRAEAKQGRKFILVTFNYRTNIFGFFSGPDVQAADEKGLSGNYGAYDAIAALEWVQENIDAFGGDKDSVTCFGESAGSFLVSSLLVCGKRLFKRAIMQSGAPDTMSTFPLERAYGAYSTVLNSHGPGGATPRARMNALRQVPVEALLKTHNETYSFTGISLAIEEGSHAIWNEKAMDKIERGEWDAWIERVIIGTNEDEGTMFAHGLQISNEAGFTRYVSNLPQALHPIINQKYLHDAPYPTQVSLVDSPGAKLIADQIFIVPAWRQVKAMARQPNKKNGKKTTVFLYRFREQIDALKKACPLPLGAMHAIEIGFVFNLAFTWTEGSHEAKTAALMGSMWSRFAVTGNPDPNWQPFTLEQPTWLAIEEGGKAENESLAEFENTLFDFSGKSFGLDLSQTNTL